MNVLQKISKFQINQASKTDKTLQTSSTKMNGHPSRQILTLLTFISGGLCLKSTKPTYRSLQIRQNCKSCSKLSGTTCHKSPLRRPSQRSERDCKRVSELMVDTLSTYFHSNQHSRPSHKNRPFSGPPHNFRRVQKSIIAFSSLVNLKF